MTTPTPTSSPAAAATQKLQWLSQELFDESVLENQELFEELNDDDDLAVQETLQQYNASSSSSSSPLCCCCTEHLCLTHPHSPQGIQQRREQREFVEVLQRLDACVQEDGSVVLLLADKDKDDDKDSISKQLRRTQECCRVDHDRRLAHLVLLQQHQAMFTLLSFLGVCEGNAEDEKAEEVLQESLHALVIILTLSPVTSRQTRLIRSVQQDLRELVGAAAERWAKLCYPSPNDDDDASLLLSSCCTSSIHHLLLLKFARVSCQHCEANKVRFFQALRRSDNFGISRLLDDLSPNDNDDDHEEINLQAARFLTVLCQFDDDHTISTTNSSSSTASATPTVSSAHSHVLELARAGAVPVLHTLLQHVAALNSSSSSSNHNNLNLYEATLSALRVLAIQDEVVQSMVAVGVLAEVKRALEVRGTSTTTSSAGTSGPDEVSKVHAAALGLVRNLCANDDIKTSLCLGGGAASQNEDDNNNSSSSILPVMERVVKAHLDHAKVQEHACATLAAMALRRPRNAEHIVLQYGGHVWIVTAMKRHVKSVLVQRQGALALRNLASRAQESVREAILEAGAEEVLRRVAGQHQGSVDEAYAALRDLQCEVTLVRIDARGRATTAPAMFGESRNANFRPVFETSSALAEKK